MSFWTHILDTTGFPPRWYCGVWTPAHGWLHILSDIGIWAAYFTIPIMLYMVATRRTSLRFRGQFLLFAAFIFSCGMTHFMEATIFWWPAYRLAGVLKFTTAVVSWATVISLVRVAPIAFRMRTHDELESEVNARKEAEAKLLQLNSELEARVQSRVAELAAANEQLHQQREWFRTTLSSIGDAVIATDSMGQITLLNTIATELTGWTSQDAVGKPLESVFRIVDGGSREPADNPAIRALNEQTIVGLSNNTWLIDKNLMERPIDDSAAPIRDAQGNITGAVLVFRDVTENRRLEEQVRQSQKMEAIGRFAGGIAHDFNNLLTVINGYTQMLQAEELGVTCVDYVDEIQRAGARATALTQQLLAFSRMQLAQPTVLDLNEAVREVSRMLERLIGEDVSMIQDLAADLWPIKADRVQMEQILVNLAVNSRDAMPNGGRIELTTSNVTLTEHDQALLVDAEPGDYVRLEFKDNGCGMNQEVRSRAFEPYFTTKESGKGTGLGLATVFGIVKQNRGLISLESQPDAGTTVTVYFPKV